LKLIADGSLRSTELRKWSEKYVEWYSLVFWLENKTPKKVSLLSLLGDEHE